MTEELSQQLTNAQRQLQQLRQQQGIDYRPAVAIGGPAAPAAPLRVEAAPMAELAEAPAAEPVEVYHHGQIALAANRAGHSCHYQLWLALRHLDPDGRGWVSKKTAQDALCVERGTNSTYLYKLPRLRQLLVEGNDIYWRLDDANQRIFYLKESRLAAALGVLHFTGRHVAISAAEIFTNIQGFRAHCFAAWLANRDNPISQHTIEQLTGIPARTQLRYCTLADIITTDNLSIGPRYSQQNHQECAWYHEGTFKFADYRGKQGPEGRRYVAWHLPTSYSVNAATSSVRRQKRTNNQLAGLRRNPNAGNSRLQVLFFRNGKVAAKVAGRQMSVSDGDRRDHYWPGTTARTGTKLWHCLTV
jgi:hypothetical protein